MNYQQSYPGVWLGGGTRPLPPHRPLTAEEIEAEEADQAERDAEAAIDMAREIREGRYDS